MSDRLGTVFFLGFLAVSGIAVWCAFRGRYAEAAMYFSIAGVVRQSVR